MKINASNVWSFILLRSLVIKQLYNFSRLSGLFLGLVSYKAISFFTILPENKTVLPDNLRKWPTLLRKWSKTRNIEFKKKL